MGSPQFRFCLTISDSGTGERTGDTASRLVIVTLGTDSRLRHPRSVPAVRPVGEGSLTASHGPLRGLPDAASMPRTDRSPTAFGLSRRIGSRSLSWASLARCSLQDRVPD